MIVALTIAAALAPAPAYAGSLENVFISACLDGSIKLSPQEAHAVQLDALPKAVRAKLGDPSKAQVWQLQSAGRSYLYTMEYEGTSMSPKICGLASDQLKITPAAQVIAARLNSSADMDSRAVTTEWHFPDQGYYALASRVHEYTVLQVNQMSDWQREEALRNK